MIQFFNNFSKGWGAKIILGFLTLSMIVVWGLGGFLNTNIYGSNDAARVGSEKISMPELVNEFNAEKQRMSTMMGGVYLSNRQAIEAGLLDQTVQKLVMERVQDQIISKLGLAASNEAVRKYVERNPAFSDALGNFDKNMFYAYLSQSRMSESQLAVRLQKELAYQHMANTVRDLGYSPKLMAELAYKFQNEKRDIEYAFIKPENIAITEKPSDEKLQDYYDAYAEELIMPEFRAISVVVVTPELMLDRVEVDADEVNELVAERKNQFTIPEKRTLLQMRTDSEQSANELMKGLKSSNFAKVAKDKLKQSDDQTNFGDATKSGMLEELADPVFNAKKGAVVGPIESPLGWHIFLVKDIKPAQIPSDDKIRAEIKKQLANEKIYDTMYQVSRQLEDILGAGDSLEWAATELKLPIQKIDAVNVSGQDLNGKDVAIKNPSLLQEVFTTSVGNATQMVEHDSGYVVAKVEKITPAHQKDFKLVRADLVQMWTLEQQKNKLESVADTVLKRVQSGNALKTQGTFANFKVNNVAGVSRSKSDELPRALADAVFKQQTGNANATLTQMQDGSYVISVVTNVKKADLANDKVGLGIVEQNMKRTIGDVMAQDVMSSYASDFGVHVDNLSIEKTFATFVQGDE